LDILVCVEVREHSLVEDLILLVKKNILDFDRDTVKKILDIIINLALKESDIIASISPTFELAKKYIDQNIDKAITINSVCKYINLDKSYFIRKLKNIYSISPKQYIIDMKLDMALSYLKEGLSTLETCEKVGYESSESFTIVFKKKFGITPHAYKHQFSRS